MYNEFAVTSRSTCTNYGHLAVGTHTDAQAPGVKLAQMYWNIHAKTTTTRTIARITNKNYNNHNIYSEAACATYMHFAPFAVALLSCVENNNNNNNININSKNNDKKGTHEVKQRLGEVDFSFPPQEARQWFSRPVTDETTTIEVGLGDAIADGCLVTPRRCRYVLISHRFKAAYLFPRP
ncbi:unnamed protein product [Polarella glacialis]|uniref:Uncharacterized protein n=1 Tax=Polarella glacialis TaxID=89957 RepID=A0A813KQY0_POLGL|nr:unnamed protein product [Polarella glacialis]